MKVTLFFWGLYVACEIRHGLLNSCQNPGFIYLLCILLSTAKRHAQCIFGYSCCVDKFFVVDEMITVNELETWMWIVKRCLELQDRTFHMFCLSFTSLWPKYNTPANAIPGMVRPICSVRRSQDRFCFSTVLQNNLGIDRIICAVELLSSTLLNGHDRTNPARRILKRNHHPNVYYVSVGCTMQKWLWSIFYKK